MIRIRRILLPTDFSCLTDGARPHAFELARQFKAELFVLHVPLAGAQDAARNAFDEAAEDGQLVRKMHSLMAIHAMRSHAVRYRVVRTSSAVAGILQFIRDSRIDLAVMGCQGGSGSGRSRESVTQRVARLSPCPVLAVEHSPQGNSPFYRRILVALDVARPSSGTFDFSVGLATRFGAEIHALCVRRKSRFRNAGVKTGAGPSAGLEKVHSLFECFGVEVSGSIHLPDDYGHEPIVRVARASRADLTVLSPGVVSPARQERILAEICCPVITFSSEPTSSLCQPGRTAEGNTG